MYAWGAGLYSLVIMCSDACLNLDLHHLYKRGDLENWARYICQCSSTSSNTIVQCDINLDSSFPQQKLQRRVMYCKQWKAGVMAWERDQCDEPPARNTRRHTLSIVGIMWCKATSLIPVFRFPNLHSYLSSTCTHTGPKLLFFFFQFCTDAAAVSERVVYASEDV